MSFREERRDSPLWLTVYSDFVTNLVLFFLVLYAVSLVSDQQEIILKKIESSVLPPDNTALALEEIIREQNLDDLAMVSIDEKRIRIVLRESITFKSGDDVLIPEGFPVLDEIIGIIMDIPNSVIIEGHTDDVPISRSRRFFTNWELSGARAVSVLKHLIQNGIDPERLSAVGFGEHRPIFSNETPQGRALNRRVEITIVRL